MPINTGTVVKKLIRMLMAALITGLITVTLLNPSYAVSTPLSICVDYHCDETVKVTLSPDQLNEIKTLFTQVKDAATERQPIRQASGLLEKQVGEMTGTWRDLGKNPPHVSNEPGQLDCIAESMNTNTYLHLLADQQLLHWYAIESRQKRTLWIFATHWTAVIKDTQSGIRYAVDSWFLDNGEPPFIQEFSAWAQGEKFE